MEEEQRAELLERRSSGGPAGWRRPGLDEEAALQGHLSNSKRVLEEAYQTGTAILGNMSSQRERLKVGPSPLHLASPACPVYKKRTAVIWQGPAWCWANHFFASTVHTSV